MKMKLAGPLLLTLMSMGKAEASSWLFDANPSLTQGTYSGSIERSSLTDRGIKVSASYLDQGAITAGYSRTLVAMKTAPTIDQDNWLLSGHFNRYLDSGHGRLSFRLDGYRLNNNDFVGQTGGVTTIAPQVSWLSNDGMLYADLGYARSGYQNALTVQQYTPTAGFGLNGGNDWIQFRAFLIRGLNPLRAEGKSATTGADAKWTHYFAAGSPLKPSSVSLGISLGEKIYAVDMDAMSVANLADLQRGGETVGLGWKISRDAKLFALAGQMRYTNTQIANDYRLNVGYVDLSFD
ncbi:MAG: hypothetical protein HKL98_01010 [Burkholderiales bacterium]|nr:hypothetical protein [Burkholderiales bacterium]